MTYLLYDGRAVYDVDKATVLDICDSLREAKRECREWGHCVVVEYRDTQNSLKETGRKWEWDHEAQRLNLIAAKPEDA